MTFEFLKMVLTTCRYAMCISLGVLSVSGTASATLIESIAALEEGAMYRVLFVTSTYTFASSSDIEYYNDIVSTAAASGSLTGSLGLTWKALASTASMNAQTNTGILNSDNSMVTMFNTFGEIVATSGADLWGSTLTLPIKFEEGGGIGGTYVWTGTASNGEGVFGKTLGGVTGNSVLGRNNIALFEPFYYSDSFSNSSTSLPLYGVSSVVSKPLTDVPEPGTVILLSLGLAGLSFARYRRQS